MLWIVALEEFIQTHSIEIKLLHLIFELIQLIKWN